MEFHEYHPLVLFPFFFMILVITMLTKHPVVLAITIIQGLIYIGVQDGAREVVKKLMSFLMITIVMVFINGLFCNNGATVLFYINAQRITLESVQFGLHQALLFFSLFLWFQCFSKNVDSEKIIYLFGKMTPALAMTISMILRYLPLLKKRYEQISLGQYCMGREGKQAGIAQKIKTYFKKLSILAAWSLENSMDTADSMEARGYGLKGRHFFHLYRFRMEDCFFALEIVGGTILLFYVLVTGGMNILFYPETRIAKLDMLESLACLSYGVLLLVPTIVDLRGRYKWKQLS